MYSREISKDIRCLELDVTMVLKCHGQDKIEAAERYAERDYREEL